MIGITGNYNFKAVNGEAVLSRNIKPTVVIEISCLLEYARLKYRALNHDECTLIF